MSLGWRLGLSTAIIVALILGILILVQQWREIRRDWKDRDTLLGESLIPLASDIEGATSQKEIRERVSAFQQAYLKRGYTRYHVDLRDGEGRIIISSSGRDVGLPSWTLHASIPVSSPLLNGGRGSLRVWQEGLNFKAEVERRWVFWLLDIGVAVLCILVFLQIAHQYLVARPLQCLMEGIRHMEMGYWGGLKIPKGAWEMRWLAYRFQKLGTKLEETLQHLVEAERRALLRSNASPNALEKRVTKDMTCPDDILALPEAPIFSEKNLFPQGMRRLDLLEKCSFLESQCPFGPAAQAIARKVWEQDVSEAESLCEYDLKCKLEDAAFRILNPDAFEQLSTDLMVIITLKKKWVKKRKQEILKVLKKRQLSCLEVQHRVKHVAGIWRKMQVKGLSLEQIHDIFAFRIIVSEEQECYLVLDAIHQHFKPLLLRFKDYIARPKVNGYKSIHTCVRGLDNLIFEVQIRTAEMHRQAEGGTAAHWRYKAEQPSRLGAPSFFSRRWRRLKAVLHLVGSGDNGT
jgi:ppGpp synthetase/RelA/SpoT-type nucleotidyltranferase